MSKSLNFVVSIKLDRRSTDVNGNHPIKLRVWNRATKKVKLYSCNKFTDTTLFEKALNQGATVKGETFKLRLYLKRVLSNASDVLENNNVKSFKDFEKHMFNRTDDSKDINFYISQKIDQCYSNNQFSSRDIYKGLLSLLETYTEGKSVQASELSVEWFKSLESWYLNRKKSNGEKYSVSSFSIYVRHFRVVINELYNQNIIDYHQYPFGKGKYQIPSSLNNKRPLSSENIRKILIYNSKNTFKQRGADFWKLSYLWSGINLKDVINLKWSDVHDDKIYYYRRKTFNRSKVKQKNTVFIDDRISKIIQKYKGTESYIFNVLNDSMNEEQVYKAGKNLIRKINLDLKKVAKELGSQGFEAKMRSVLMLTQDEVEKSLRHLCVVKNNYLADKAKSESYILKFNDHLAFENTGDRIELDKIVYQDWIEDAKDMREKGLSYRMISERLKEDGYNVSKSVLQRKLS